jgi:L-ascorbate metabolism protein UlaG (beta-lactamase superfamily)
VLITGLRTYHDKVKGAELGRNVTYVIDIDDIRICHLGDIGHVPSGDDVELLSATDVLLIPVGGHTTIDAAVAAEIVSMLEPSIVIPMQYQTEAAVQELDPLDKFLKEMGTTGMAAQPRLSVTKSSLPQDTAVMPLEYRG